jgi:hypothetical protein
MPMVSQRRVVVYGAGFTGVAVAHRLLVHCGVRSVAMIDPAPPLTLLSRPGRVTYRNWWPGADEASIRLANRTIDLLEDLDRAAGDLALDRRGDLLVTTRREQLEHLRAAAARLAQHGLGPLREHQSPEWYLPSPITGTRGVADGNDVLEGGPTLRSLFPAITPLAVGAIHVRRAGSLDGSRVVRRLWQEAAGRGLDTRRDDLVAIDGPPGGPVELLLASGARLGADEVVLAPGGRFAPVAARLGLMIPLGLEALPLFVPAELDRILPNDSPNLVSVDSERLEWSGTEAARLERDPLLRALLFELPGGFEVSQGGGAPAAASWGPSIRIGHWEWPPVVPLAVREAMVRVLVRLVPAAIHARGGGRGGTASGSYAVVTEDRHPMIGRFVHGPIHWLGGFGRMAPSLALAAADLLARSIAGEPLPAYLEPFAPDRFTERKR